MNQLKTLLRLSAAVVLGGLSLAAQTTSSTLVTISTSVQGMQFSVDGAVYRSAAAFTWPTGSKHILDIPPGEDLVVHPGTKSSFTGWATTSGTFSTGSKTITVTADPTITGYIAQFSQQFLVSLQFADGRVTPPQATPTCAQPGDPPPTESLSGVVNIGGACYWSDYSFWTGAGVIQLQAFPYPGFVFAGWRFNGAKNTSFITSIDIEAPLQIQANFARAQRAQFLTNPAGLKVMIDGQSVPTPTSLPCPDRQTLPPTAPSNTTPLCYGEFDFLPGSTHVISAPSPQRDTTSNYWVFSAWNKGGGQNTNYVVPMVGPEDMLTANFVPGVTASLTTVPTGLTLTVDGRSNWPSLNFIWGVGLQHTVTAPTQQTDAKGRKYVFVSWSNGGAQTQTLVAQSGGLRLSATYQLLSRAVVQSNIPGITIMVDGQPCKTPCTIDRPSGSQATVAVSQSIAVSDVTRYDFTGWVGGSYTPTTTITFNSDYQMVPANYVTMNRLMTASDPAGGVDIITQPASADNYFPTNAQLVVTAKPHQGFKFVRWDGDLNGTYPVGYLDMGAPRLVRAILNRVPYIAPAGVRNAAGETPGTGVAAGSLITIYGESLADSYVAGPSSPLAQTLGGVVVQMEDRLLQLVYVSPQQINALLPSDIGEGEHQLAVKRTGVADVQGKFTVVRNAPGLFGTGINNQIYAIAMHEDGTIISLTSPAKRGERVTLLGTGFGPYDHNPIAGFTVPATPQYTLVDNAEVSAGDLILPTTWSGAAPGYVGVAASQFRVADELPSGAPSITLTVNGVQSNAVLLPVE